MTSQECETLRLLTKQTSGLVTVADTHLSVVSNRTSDTECLLTDTDSLGSLGSVRTTFLDSDSGTYYVSPASVLETARLSFLTHCIRVDTFSVADSLCIFDTVDTIFF